MERQAGVLQQRVEILAVERRLGQPQERVRGEDDETQKRHPDHRLNAQHPRLESGRKPCPEPRRRRTKTRQDQHPQEHRAFVIAPDTRHLVKQRLQGVRVKHHQAQRKIRCDKGIGERREGKAQTQELGRRGRRGHRHPAAPSLLRPDQRNHRLQRGNRHRKDQGEMAEFRNHPRILMRPAAKANALRADVAAMCAGAAFSRHPGRAIRKGRHSRRASPGAADRQPRRAA